MLIDLFTYLDFFFLNFIWAEPTLYAKETALQSQLYKNKSIQKYTSTFFKKWNKQNDLN